MLNRLDTVIGLLMKLFKSASMDMINECLLPICCITMLPKEEFKSIKNSTKSPILGDKHFQRDFGVNLLNGISQIPAKKRG